MQPENPFTTGMQAEATFIVAEQDSAGHVGSGSLRVLATPSMIAYIERTARIFMDERLPQGSSSVGVHVDVRHLAATPVGMQVRVSCEVSQVDGRRVDFIVGVWDQVEKVGEGLHQRYVIDVERFLKRLEIKIAQAGA
jgi:fluoroacetyl-CoA thioesterase